MVSFRHGSVDCFVPNCAAHLPVPGKQQARLPGHLVFHLQGEWLNNKS